MATEEVAVDGASVNHKAGSGISLGSFTIISVPSTKELENGKGIFTKELKVTFLGGNAAGMVPGSVFSKPPSATIDPTADSKFGGEKAMRKGDNTTMDCQGTTTPVPPGSPGDVSGDIEIDDAGQTNLKVN